MADDAAELLAGSGKEAWHIFEGHQWNVERIAEAHEASARHRRIDIEAAGQVRRLVGHYSNGAAIQARDPRKEGGETRRTRPLCTWMRVPTRSSQRW